MSKYCAPELVQLWKEILFYTIHMPKMKKKQRASLKCSLSWHLTVWHQQRFPMAGWPPMYVCVYHRMAVKCCCFIYLLLHQFNLMSCPITNMAPCTFSSPPTDFAPKRNGGGWLIGRSVGPNISHSLDPAKFLCLSSNPIPFTLDVCTWMCHHICMYVCTWWQDECLIFMYEIMFWCMCVCEVYKVTFIVWYFTHSTLS